ncbi:MAG: hypothetical protein HQK86_13900, partial [Nitrospinae bacterium]|nr:hypothetical protein [Nitrospinota bacterium]
SSAANAVFPGDGLPATSVVFHYTGGMAIGADNALYFPQYGGKGRTTASARLTRTGSSPPSRATAR